MIFCILCCADDVYSSLKDIPRATTVDNAKRLMTLYYSATLQRETLSSKKAPWTSLFARNDAPISGPVACCSEKRLHSLTARTKLFKIFEEPEHPWPKGLALSGRSCHRAVCNHSDFWVITTPHKCVFHFRLWRRHRNYCCGRSTVVMLYWIEMVRVIWSAGIHYVYTGSD